MKRIFTLLILLLLGLATVAQTVTVTKKNYKIAFDTSRCVPLYTEYWLTGAHLKSVCKRTGFTMDPTIDSKYQSNGSEYKGSGYDKGHFAPDDDFRFDSVAQKEAMLYTNAAPQAFAFNRGVWKMVEDYTRWKAKIYDSVFVITGAIYGQNKLGKLSIPMYYYKILIYGGHTEEFVGKNEAQENNIDKLRHSTSDFLNYTIQNLYSKGTIKLNTK